MSVSEPFTVAAKSRRRMSSSEITPPARAMMPVMMTSSLMPAANDDLITAARWARCEGGTELMAWPTAPLRTSVSTWAAFTCDPVRPRVMPWLSRAVKTDPRAAMLAAMPTWRKVVLIPDAMPAR